ncbi:unnamed protein product [Strongylus vulgaris]|uniref:Gamma-glutamyltranspeptidase n=1 Tax=Strongylus vulgaris TaxID=40348 RepID=A0A3P7IF21_STRVU|nr:unnamed protein product [Strongylus vulgaris]
MRTCSLYFRFFYGFGGTLVLAAIVVTIVVLSVTAKTDSKKDIAHEFDWPPPSNSVEGRFRKAALSSDHALCSEIGGNVLKNGGNAADASVAIMFCIGVTNPESSGIGGGFIMTIYNK